MLRNPRRQRLLSRIFLKIGTCCLFAVGCLSIFSESLRAQTKTAVESQKTSPENQRRRKDPPNLTTHGESDSPKDSGEKDKSFRFGVEVDLVVLPTTVTDKEGNFISGLKQEDFSVYENKVQQPITYFAQVDMPITIGLVIDISGSMRSKIALVNQAAMQFLKLSNPKDETFLISFNHEVNLIEDFTDDLDTIREALDNVSVSGGTALYDAILLAVQKAQKGSRQKHALLIISDGEDRDSYYKLDEVLRIIQESNVQAYVIGFLGPQKEESLFDVFSKNPQERAKAGLNKIAQETGAKAIFPKDTTQLAKIMEGIAHELRNQYHIGYVPASTTADGSWRGIQISLANPIHKNLRVRTRSGYYADKSPKTSRQANGADKTG